MSSVRVQRLRLKTHDGGRMGAQARTEDALRLAAHDDGRLLVLRRLNLGRLPVTAPRAAWQARATDRIATLAASAVHGATADAARAEAVWFASIAEARTLLLLELAAGKVPFGWFWRLAVPDWQGLPLAIWVPRLLAEAQASPEQLVAFSIAVVRIAAAGHLPALLAALPGGDEAASAQADLMLPGPVSLPDLPASASIDQELAEAALVQFDRLPAAARAALFEALRRAPADPARELTLARLALVAAAPERAARSETLALAAAALVAAIHAAPRDVTHPAVSVPRPSPEIRPQVDARDRPIEPAHHRTEKFEAPGAPHAPPAIGEPLAPDNGALDGPADRQEQVDRPEQAYRREQASTVAGVWLLINALTRLGLPRWLEARADLAAAGFARALLRHIAQRHRAPDEDPGLALLPEAVVAIDPALLDAWRIGLDRWLRRRVRRTLSHVVRRHGWLSPHDSGVRVRFRLDQADIALRMRALDVDPGWVPWLGLTLAYDYRDDPPSWTATP